MEFRVAVDGDLMAMSRMAANMQADPAGAIAYLGVGADGIAGELADIDWCSVSALAVDGERLTGWLVGDVDPELGRVFWLGPFVSADDWEAVATGLYTNCSGQLPSDVSEQEMAIDSRFERLERWAASLGFAPGHGSAALVLEAEVDDPEVTTRPVVDADLGQLGALHEQLFPGTHTTGRQLVMERDRRHGRLVVEVDGVLAGYVAYELQPDGAGYIDFLGVTDRFRGAGLGAQLVRASVVELRRLEADPIHLTVRQDNHAARALYASLGFTEERVIRPLRKGFEFT
jgi:ribosomal-protein-alanine N-acetyltransferase